jgi:hypothetical protein
VKHAASPKFWTAYQALPSPVQKLADANFALLKRDPPSVTSIQEGGTVLVSSRRIAVPRFGD